MSATENTNNPTSPDSHATASRSVHLRELAALFLRLGATAFGGPAAHIVLMEDEVVTRKRWLDRAQFLDLVGATNLIPGPNSTELAIHIGYLRAGWPGLLVAGVCFILPAFCIVLALAWLYQNYGALPQAQSLLRGVQPVVLAIVAQALWKFAGTALKPLAARLAAFAALALLVIGVSELAVLGLAAAFGLLVGLGRQKEKGKGQKAIGTDTDEAVGMGAAKKPARTKSSTAKINARQAILLLPFALCLLPFLMSPLRDLFWAFLKIGSILYGSGYVLLAFLQAEFVPRLMTERQLLDAVAVGQITPGPVFTTATFIGFQLAGWPGALAATVGIFLPSFFFVALLAALMQRLQTSPVLRGFLDAVNAASLALMAWVTWQLARTAIADAATVVSAITALALLLRTRLNPTWLLAAGVAVGWLLGP